MNVCDHGHDTKEEVRLLPIGGSGNAILCRAHYEKEMNFRRGHADKYGSDWNFPKFGDLKIYRGDK